MKKSKWIGMVVLLFGLVFAPSVFAFSDLQGNPDKAKINVLQEAGVIDGVGDGRFAPGADVTWAQGVQLAVRGLKLNIDSLRFIKQPQASDYFSKVPDDAWYAQAFIIAQLNGLPVDLDTDPNALMTREQFTELLVKGVLTTGSYIFSHLWVNIADSGDVTGTYMNSIQIALKTGIAHLDKDGNFHPKQEITRSEAAVMTYEAVQFVNSHKEDQSGSDSGKENPVTVSVEKINEQINAVTLSWGIKPTAGYRLTIDGITFRENGVAVIRYSLYKPDFNHTYAQVITEAKATTYLDSKYTPVAEQTPSAAPTPAPAPAQSAPMRPAS